MHCIYKTDRQTDRQRQRETETDRDRAREDNTLLHDDKDLSTSRLFSKFVPDDKDRQRERESDVA